MSLAEPSSRTWTFVDKWELSGYCPARLQNALDRLEFFATMLDLQMDQTRSMVWAVTTSDGAMLGEGSVQVVKNAKDLGGHLQFTRTLTNSTLVAKCQKLSSMGACL